MDNFHHFVNIFERIYALFLVANILILLHNFLNLLKKFEHIWSHWTNNVGELNLPEESIHYCDARCFEKSLRTSLPRLLYRTQIRYRSESPLPIARPVSRLFL